MQHTDTVVIGAGQAGLAMSRSLTDMGRDHVVLERGRVAESWRRRWESLRLLTPNWMTRLPGWSYAGPDPDGFMARDELVGFFENYAASFDAPVQDETTVIAVERRGERSYSVLTDQGLITATNVVVATGAADVPHVPAFAAGLSSELHQVPSARYRDPSSLPAGGVLVVGASATGVQLADELRRAGREVVLAAGAHTRVPRTYRGMDIMWWLDRTGAFERTVDTVADPVAATREPSMQLVGGHEDLDLAVLQARGVRVAGRAVGADGFTVDFADDLAASASTADCRLRQLLVRIDVHAAATGLDTEVGPPTRPAPTPVPATPDRLDLRVAGISTVVWATGYRRSYPWLQVPVLDGAGEIRHDRGVTPASGLYVLGLRFQYRRRSNFIDGVGEDARYLAVHLASRSRQGVAA